MTMKFSGECYVKAYGRKLYKKGVILKKEVTVKDAGGSDIAYYRYMMQLDNALGSNINIA